MRKTHKRGLIAILQVLLMVAFIPFLLGQNECKITQKLADTIQKLIPKAFPPPPGQKYVYVTRLSFIDVELRDVLSSLKNQT